MKLFTWRENLYSSVILLGIYIKTILQIITATLSVSKGIIRGFGGIFPIFLIRQNHLSKTTMNHVLDITAFFTKIPLAVRFSLPIYFNNSIVHQVVISVN